MWFVHKSPPIILVAFPKGLTQTETFLKVALRKSYTLRIKCKIKGTLIHVIHIFLSIKMTREVAEMDDI